MPYFALTYDVVDDFTARRTPYRPQHLQLARDAAARGELVMAGALGEPAGALLSRSRQVGGRDLRGPRPLRHRGTGAPVVRASLDRRDWPRSVGGAARTTGITPVHFRRTKLFITSTSRPDP